MPQSKFSATMIGHTEDVNSKYAAMKEHYKAEARDVCQYVSSKHPSRRQKAMQVYYPETINTLNASLSKQTLQPQEPKPAPQQAPKEPSKRETQEKGFYAQWNTAVKSEHDFNHRKLNYNRSQGSKAIMTGRAPVTKEALYPQKPNHQMLLAISGSLKMPDPYKMPPPVPKTRKWLGSDKGWEA